MHGLVEQIVEQIRALPEGRYLTAKELLHLGSRPAVDQALSRLARSGRLIRVSRGLYVRPIQGQFGSRPPAASKTVEALGEQRGETVVRHGCGRSQRAWPDDTDACPRSLSDFRAQSRTQIGSADRRASSCASVATGSARFRGWRCGSGAGVAGRGTREVCGRVDRGEALGNGPCGSSVHAGPSSDMDRATG